LIRAALILSPSILLAAFVALVLWHAGSSVPRLGETIISGTANVGGPFRLTDQNGQSRTDADLRGRFMLVYFGYTNCPDVCPTTLNVISDAQKKLGNQSSRVRTVFITLDPVRDTPSVLRFYLHAFGGHITGLTGSASAIRQAAREYHVYFAEHPLAGGAYSVDHSNTLYLMGPDGKFVTFYDESIGPDALAADLRNRLSG
jgi:protein SCO1